MGERVGIALRERGGVGESLNEEWMVGAGGVGVGMGNGREDIKEMGDDVRLRNDEDGVGHMIGEVLKQKYEMWLYK